MDRETYRIPGFLFNGIHVGIKDGGRRDLSLIYSQVPAIACGVFTTNDFKAAPVVLSMERIKRGKTQAILINSGNANAATGEQGYNDAVAMSRATAFGLGLSQRQVLVASTGKIGDRLPLEKIEAGIPCLISGLAEDRIIEAEEGIMTTDRFPKIEIRKRMVGARQITICGIAKGAGMIEPHMATMLSFVMTDAAIDCHVLDEVFRANTEKTFNAISVDGCMSTNDTAVILANGFAGNDPFRKGTDDFEVFGDMLYQVLEALAKSMVRDGEGATRMMEILIEGAETREAAARAAYAIARSNLVKTALYGQDPNWGRIISAVGSAGLHVPSDKTEVYLERLPVFRNGCGVEEKKEELAAIMKKDIVKIVVKLGMGSESFRVFASDLSHDYIHINADYHT